MTNEAQHEWVDDILEYYWDGDDRTILIIEFHDYHTWDQYYKLMKGVYNFIDGRVDEVAYINIFHKGMVAPQGSALPHFQNMLKRFNNPIIVWVDLAPMPAYTRFMKILTRILKQPDDRSAPDVPSARHMIQQIREKATT